MKIPANRHIEWRRWESNPREVPPNSARLTVPAFLVRFALFVVFAVCFLAPLLVADALAHVPGCHTRKCDRRIHQARVTRWLWRHYRARPMPRCTWIPESGPLALYGEYARARYRVVNSSSTAAGKYQLLDQSAHAVGIRDFPGIHDAAKATPLQQERAARRLLAMQGLGAWARC